MRLCLYMSLFRFSIGFGWFIMQSMQEYKKAKTYCSIQIGTDKKSILLSYGKPNLVTKKFSLIGIPIVLKKNADEIWKYKLGKTTIYLAFQKEKYIGCYPNSTNLDTRLLEELHLISLFRKEPISRSAGWAG